MTQTKQDAAATLAEKGIALPDNWSKLSTERALTWAANALAAAPETTFMGKAKKAVKSALGLDKAARKNAGMKVFSDPNYRRTTNKTRQFLAANAPPKEAVNPEKPSRQMWRRFQIDQHKQPLEMSQEEWHKIKGYGKVQPFGSSIRQTRNKAERKRREAALRQITLGKAA